MAATNELYMLHLTTGRKVVAAIDKEYDMSISEKKHAIIKDMNEKFGCDIVSRVTFYGYANIYQNSRN